MCLILLLVVNDLADCSLDQINSGAAVGTRYIDVAEQTEGITGNICGDDFASIVTELSLAHLVSMTCSF